MPNIATRFQPDISGSAVPSGFIGQVITGVSDASTSLAASNSDKTITTLPLLKGIWLITGNVLLDFSGLTLSRLQSSISTGTNATAGSIYNILGLDLIEGVTGLSQGYAVATYGFTINISADTTYNVNARAFYTGTPLASPLRAVIRAIRIA